MTQDEAIRKAVAYIENLNLKLGPIVDIRHLSVEILDAMEAEYPTGEKETYKTVRRKFRNHWVVSFQIPKVPNQVSTPETETVCVYDSGDIELMRTM